jgi:hypothetical protein
MVLNHLHWSSVYTLAEHHVPKSYPEYLSCCPWLPCCCFGLFAFVLIFYAVGPYLCVCYPLIRKAICPSIYHF